MDPTQVANACGDSPELVALYLPHVVNGLAHFGINDHATRIAAFATCAVEMDWQYLTELASGQEYEGRADLGNTQPGDGVRYKGRGFCQVTGRHNYKEVGDAIGVDLINNPEMACYPHIAGLTMGYYFKTHGIQAMANAGDLYGIRRAVNGGLNGITRFLNCVAALQQLPDEVEKPRNAVTTVALRDQLRQKPVDKKPDAIDQHGREVVLEVGTVVHFLPDPSPGPYHSKITTPNWCHISVNGTPIHGWFKRASLQTK